MSAFCNNCGTALPPAARFCSVCGAVVSGMPPAGAPPFGFQPYQTRLVRPIHGRQFAGVCIALARTYGWDVGVVRILTVVAGIFLFPFTEVVYLACWIGIPEETLGETPYTAATPQPPPQPPVQL